MAKSDEKWRKETNRRQKSDEQKRNRDEKDENDEKRKKWIYVYWKSPFAHLHIKYEMFCYAIYLLWCRKKKTAPLANAPSAHLFGYAAVAQLRSKRGTNDLLWWKNAVSTYLSFADVPQVKCPGVGGGSEEQTLDNLCGDLNKGYLPVNPIGECVKACSHRLIHLNKGYLPVNPIGECVKACSLRLLHLNKVYLPVDPKVSVCSYCTWTR